MNAAPPLGVVLALPLARWDTFFGGGLIALMDSSGVKTSDLSLGKVSLERGRLYLSLLERYGRVAAKQSPPRRKIAWALRCKVAFTLLHNEKKEGPLDKTRLLSE